MVVSGPARATPRWLLLIALAVGCRDETPPPTPEATPRAEVPLRADTVTVAVPLTFPAQVYVEHDAVIAARSAGVIESLFVDIGSEVSSGALLAQIESVDQELELAMAETAREQGERAAARARALRDVQGMSAAEAEQAEFQARAAELDLRAARRALELTRIVAPFAGRVTARYVQPRRLVAVGDTLFRIAESEPLLARIRVPEAAALTIRTGTRVDVLAGSATLVPGTVVMVAPAIDAASGTREVILRLTRADGLMPGSAVTVRLGSEQRQVLAVPREAISPDSFVLVRVGDRTMMRAVVLGRDLGDGRVEVVSGLRVGELLARPVR